MQIFEIAVRVKLLMEVHSDQALEVIGTCLDQALCHAGLEEFHKENRYKNYCYNSFYPLEKLKIYQSGKIYTFQVRTADAGLAAVYSNQMLQEKNKWLIVLQSQVKIIPKRFIEKIYSLSPCIMKTEVGYWRKNGDIEGFQRRLIENLIKKYNCLTGEKMKEDFQLFTSLEFHNKKPISCSYKEIHLLGDKLSLFISQEKEAQKLAYMALGTGIMELNARGYGFMNYQWL